MGRKRVHFDEPDDEQEAVDFAAEEAERRAKRERRMHRLAEEEEAGESQARLRAKARDSDAAHTLESDEEDEEDEKAGVYQLQDEDEHEELDEKFEDGGVEVTAFNLKDEMEEGHFDKDGNFIFTKKEEHDGDVWLQGADMYDAKRKVEYQGKHKSAEERLNEEAALPSDRYEAIQAIIDILRPQETVAQAMKRLGGKAGSSARRSVKRADAADAAGAAAAAEASTTDLQTLDRLTRLVEILMAENMYEIFQESREKLEVTLKEKNVPKFVFKWSDDDEAEVHGPFSAQQMLEWQNAGYFSDGVVVRETTRGKSGVFYPLSRMDFELYVDDE